MKKIIVFYAIWLILLAVGNVKAGTGNGTVPVPGRLLVIGDSLTYGLYATSENNTFARLVADQADMQLARRYVPTLSQAVAVWREVKMWNPSVVVVEVGLNDIRSNSFNDDWIQRYETLISDMRATGATVVVCTPFSAWIDGSNHRYDKYEAMSEAIRLTAERKGVMVADLWELTNGCAECVSRPSQQSYFAPHYSGDNFHPSDSGHKRIAEIIISAMQGGKIYLPVVAKG